MKCITQKSFVEIYRRLREVNPSPYMYLIDYDDYQVIGASPESVVSVKNGRASTKPIAGTRKRGETQEEGSALEKELLQDKKNLQNMLCLLILQEMI